MLGLFFVMATQDVPKTMPNILVTGEWQIRVSTGTALVGKSKVKITEPVTLKIKPSTVIQVKNEKHENLAIFNPQAAPWVRGDKFLKVKTSETSAIGMLEPESVVVKSDEKGLMIFVAGKDYDIDTHWGTFGRKEGGIPEGKTIQVDYVCGWGRVDSVFVTKKGELLLKEGVPHNATPKPPIAEKDEQRIANIWIPGRTKKLTAENLYPILEEKYPEPKYSGKPPAAEQLPKTWEKLHNGEPLHIIAWGDSVTDGGEASDAAHTYQSVFVRMLKKQFPKSNIQLTTSAWGGRNSDSFLKEPPGTKFNFDIAVIEKKPDLVIMEFVNDAYMTPEVVEEKYSYLRKRFEAIGAEWAIITPHYVRPDWMGLSSDRVESDPRPYVKGLRKFTAKYNIALADTSLRWGHLVKEGIPYMTLLVNCINHPDDQGHEMFALALMELFR